VILADQTVKVYFNPDPQLVPVPGVVGLTLEAARLKLEGEGFKIGDITIEKTDEVAENTVISTDPAADTPALQGSTVAIVVAGPPDSVQVPGQVVGMTEIDARALLEAPPYQFTVTTAVQSSSTVPEGTVIEINPGPGALVLIGSDVTIVVSTGPQPVSVPSVIGQTEGRARNSLTSSGLVVRVTFQEVPAGSPDDGRVIAQSLPSDSVVEPGTEITITVARSVQVAPTPPPTTVEPTTTVPPTTAAPTTVAPTTLPPTTVPTTTVL
jgi:serine/threonine-protein kinase